MSEKMVPPVLNAVVGLIPRPSQTTVGQQADARQAVLTELHALGDARQALNFAERLLSRFNNAPAALQKSEAFAAVVERVGLRVGQMQRDIEKVAAVLGTVAKARMLENMDVPKEKVLPVWGQVADSLKEIDAGLLLQRVMQNYVELYDLAAKNGLVKEN